MSRKFTLSLVATGLAAATGAVLAAGHASASAADNYKRCGGSSYSQVFGCCQAWAESNRPLWMRMGHQDCSSAGVIVCKPARQPAGISITHVSGSPRRICFVVKPVTEIDSKHDPRSNGGPKDGGRQGGGNSRGGQN